MRMLLPDLRDGLTDLDLDDAYAWPGWPAPTPWLRANMVSTVDGAAAGREGLSKSIGSPADRRVFGRLRGLADVVLAGAGTVREEDYKPARPKPDFAERREAAGQAPVPPLAIVSRSMRLDLGSPRFTDAAARPIVITCEASDASLRDAASEVADVIVAGGHDVDLAGAVAQLHARGLVRIHAEGGPSLLADLAAHDLLDELLLTVSPFLAGGSYLGEDDVPRILEGASLPDSPRPLRLAHLLEEDGSLFLRYVRP